MVGYLDLVRDFPSTGEWHIGLLMLDPQMRSSGLGSRIYEATAAWVASRGGHTIFLGVLEQATRAEQFWRHLGFEEVSRQSYTSETGRTKSRVIIMRHRLVHPPAA